MAALLYHKSKDQQSLVDKLIDYSGLSFEAALALAVAAAARPVRPLALLDAEATLAALPEAIQTELSTRSEVFRRAMDESFPLAVGEQQLESTITCLGDDVDEFPRGTVVLRRRTDRVELVFVHTQLRFDLERGELIDLPSVPVALAEPRPLAIGWAAIGAALGKALLSTIASQLGSAIFAKLFPAGVPAYFDQVYAEFRGIIRQEIQDNALKLLAGDVAAVHAHMHAYAAHRRQNNHRAAAAELASAWIKSVSATNVLQQFGVAGLGLFSAAGGLHLAILQERALRDDVADPNDSSWAYLYRDLSAAFYSYVQTTVATHVKWRSDQISQVEFREHWIHGPYGPIDRSYWRWRDTLLSIEKRYYRVRNCCDPDPEPTARNERSQHYHTIIGALNRDLQPARDIAAQWHRAGQQRLPARDE